MSTKRETIELANQGRGCLGKAHPDEPLFVLRAQDRFAPQLVEEWARLAAPNLAASDKVKEARALAHQMRAWQELHQSKLPD